MVNELNLTEIKDILETVAYIDKLLPEVKSPRCKCSMPEIVYTPQEIAFMDRKPLRITPNQNQINLWEQVMFEWFPLLSRDETILVWKRAKRIPWKVLCREFGYERAEMWRRYQKSLTKILFYIKGQNVGDKKG